MSWLSDLFSGDAKLLNKIKAQDFRENDSQIVSTLINPKKAGGKLADWLSNQVSTAAGLPVQPTDEGDIYAREPDRRSKAMAAMNIAGFAQGGSMPFAPKSAGGTLGTFIGPKAVNWDKKAAATATKLLDNGVDPAQVWKEHLIGRMPDKSLFSEIDDSAAKYVGPGAINKRWEAWTPHGMADKAYLHDELFKNYPELKNVGLQEIYNTEGSFNPIDKEIQIGLNDNALKILGHEFQHAIQDREGWAEGGSLGQFKGDIEALNELNKMSFSDMDAFQKEMYKQLNGKYKGIKTPYDAYRKLTGEAQARATQDRMNLNMQQRRDSYPLAKGLLADIKLKDLISRYK